MKTWDEVKNDIFTMVFQNMDTDNVLASWNLANDGFLKSLSIIMILSSLEEANPNYNYMANAEAKDFLSIETIKALYDRGSVRDV